MRTKNALLNLISDAIPQIIIGIIGIFKIQLFISLLGQEVQGVYQLYAQLFIYLAIAEGGFSSAVLYKLYKPIADGDNKKTKEILKGSAIIYKYIGLFMMVVGIILSFNLMFFIKDTTIDFSYLQLSFLIYLFSNIISYFFIINRIVFEADQKRYKVNIVTQIIVFLKSIIEIILLLLGFDLLIILLSHIFMNLIMNLIIMFMANKNYPYKKDKQVKADFSAWKDVKHLIVHKIGSAVANNVDIIIVAKFLGLEMAAIYGVYNYIIEFIRKITSKMLNAITPSIGNLLVVDNHRKSEVFNDINTIVFFIATVITIPLLITFNSFISLWVGDSMLLPNTTAYLFVAVLFIKTIRIPIIAFANASGMFKETKYLTLLEIFINLLLTLILVQFIEVQGVLIATIITYLITEFIFRARLVVTKVVEGLYQDYIYKITKALAIYIITFIFNYALFDNIFNTINNLLEWFAFGIIVTVFSTLITLLLYKLCFKNFNIISRIKKILKGNKK